ncbi:MAG: hypothetical protein EHM70_08885 [Chloroflexota bacterium]|nr:MAG: hypothetical protein EHM70_08885 [Chloroflexota bacterium]
MPVPLLQTKLFIPSLQTKLVSRPHLIQRLEEGIQAGHRLVLVSAQAGSGKTSLLGEWASTGKQQFAWVSLDHEDNDPIRFWAYLVAALQRVFPSAGQATSQLLTSPQQPPSQAILISLLNELASLPGALILALDDYHAISNPEIHTGIAFLLDHLPVQARLVIATRADPPLPVFRLRARNQVTEVREADLRFSPAETATFLNEMMGLALSGEDIQALELRTEGWIVGLQLAALALKTSASPHDHPDSHQFIATFTGSHRYILEYLMEEVLSHRSQAVQDFLIKTSILERFCGQVCDAVLENLESRREISDRSPYTILNSQSILESLERDNLFIIPLDNEHRWYRYHHLFADLLANRLRQALPGEAIQELHRRASDWLAKNDLFDEAIRQSLEGKDFERAGFLMEHVAQTMMSTGCVNTLRNWLEALPEAVFHLRPRLNIYRGWVYFLQGKSDLSEQAMQETEAMFRALPASPENDKLWVELVAVLCRNVAISGNTSRAIALAQDALPRLSADDLAFRARIVSALAIAYGLEGDVEKATQAYQECMHLAQAAGSYFLAAHTTSIMAMGLYYNGQLTESARYSQSILDMASHLGQGVFFPAGEGYIGLARIHLERNDLATAEQYLSQGMELCRQGGLAGDLFTGYSIKFRLDLAKGDLNEAREELRLLGKTYKIGEATIGAVQGVICQIRIDQAMGDIEAMARSALTLENMLVHGPVSHGLPMPIFEIAESELARFYLARGDLKRASQMLNDLQATAEPGGRFGRLVEAHLLRALVLQRQAKGRISPEAVEQLERCLELAEPEGYVRLFLEEGLAILPLLNAVLNRPAAKSTIQNYARRLLDEFSGRGQPEASRLSQETIPGELVEPLSKRELEILRLMSEGCSNQEIAARLVVTLHTVKKHSSNIFTKLGVSSRTQAVARGRQLGLL